MVYACKFWAIMAKNTLFSCLKRKNTPFFCVVSELYVTLHRNYYRYVLTYNCVSESETLTKMGG